jgi:hypothetical protein
VQSVLTLAPGAVAQAQSLGFTALSVIVDNYTSSYVVLPDAGKTIPPWTYGAVVTLPEGIRQANASLVATVPAVAGPPVPVVQAVLTWTDQPLPADPGHILSQGVYGLQVLLGQVVAPVPPGTAVTKTFNVPGGAQVVGFIVDFASGGNPAGVKINGHQTGNTYLNITNTGVLSGSPGPFTAIIASPLDTQIDVILTPGGFTDVVDVLAFMTQVNVFAQQVPGTFFAVTGAGLSWVGIADSGEPNVAVQAVATLAAVAGHSWICRAVFAEMASNAAPVASVVRLRLRDGATGVGAILKSWNMSVEAAAGRMAPPIELSGLAIKGTAGNAMTLEFSTGVANVFEACGFGADQL